MNWGFKQCPICKRYMTTYLITTSRIYYRCTCGYDSANEQIIYRAKSMRGEADDVSHSEQMPTLREGGEE